MHIRKQCQCCDRYFISNLAQSVCNDCFEIPERETATEKIQHLIGHETQETRGKQLWLSF